MMDINSCVLVKMFAGLILFSFSFMDYVGALKGVREYCQHETFAARCEDEEVVLIQNATYGRMELGRCVTSDLGFLGCSTDVLHILDRMCSGKQSCEVPVNHQDLRDASTCNDQVVSYLETSYTCVKVAGIFQGQCYSNLPPHSGLYLSSHVIQDSYCGDTLSTWIMKASPGQNIILTLYDFTNSYSNTDMCFQIGYVVEPINRTNQSICASRDVRKKQFFVSISNHIEITLIPERLRPVKGHYMLQSEVRGCADLTLPSYASYNRTDNMATVQCIYEDKKWTLFCKDKVWEGVIGNCSETPVAGSITEGGNVFTLSNVPMSLILAAAIGIAIVVASLIVICGCIVYHRRQETVEPPGHYHDNMQTIHGIQPFPYKHPNPPLPPPPPQEDGDLEFEAMSTLLGKNRTGQQHQNGGHFNSRTLDSSRTVRNFSGTRTLGRDTGTSRMYGRTVDSAYGSYFGSMPRGASVHRTNWTGTCPRCMPEPIYEVCGGHKYNVLEPLTATHQETNNNIEQ